MIVSALITLIPWAMAFFLLYLLRGVDLTGTPSDYDEVRELEEKDKREEIAEDFESVKDLRDEDKKCVDSAGHV